MRTARLVLTPWECRKTMILWMCLASSHASLIRSRLVGQLLRGDHAKSFLVCADGLRKRYQSALPGNPFAQSAVDPSAQRLCSPFGHGVIARFDEFRVDGDRQAFFSRAHTMMIILV
jgi:hypothetical protein